MTQEGQEVKCRGKTTLVLIIFDMNKQIVQPVLFHEMYFIYYLEHNIMSKRL